MIGRLIDALDKPLIDANVDARADLLPYRRQRRLVRPQAAIATESSVIVREVIGSAR